MKAYDGDSSDREKRAKLGRGGGQKFTGSAGRLDSPGRRVPFPRLGVPLRAFRRWLSEIRL